MLCEKYQQLTIEEKIVLIGKITHAIQSDNRVYDLAQKLLELSDGLGIFNGVEILPHPTQYELDADKDHETT